MAAPPPSFRFGDFSWICDRASLAICPALGLGDPQCYSRNIGIRNFLLFQPSVLAVDICALLMTFIMIMHIKSKYTAVGRKEMVIFFYLYATSVALELLLATNIVPISVSLYKYFAAGHVAATSSTFAILLLNGFVGFQWAEDGTKASIWVCLILITLKVSTEFPDSRIAMCRCKLFCGDLHLHERSRNDFTTSTCFVYIGVYLQRCMLAIVCYPANILSVEYPT